jgi:sulfite reductase (ferredoxin)
VEEGKTKLAQEVGIVPARNVPYLLKDFLKASQEKVGGYDDVYDYLEMEGKSLMEQLIEKFAYVPPYEENIHKAKPLVSEANRKPKASVNEVNIFYRDFGKEEDFTLAGIGPGECGAGVLDLIKTDLDDAQSKLNLAESQNYDVSLLSEVLHLSARALLVVRGIEPKNSEAAVDTFIKEFIHTNIASPKFKDLKDKFLSLRNAELKEDEGVSARKELFVYANQFHQEVKEVYDSMDSSFNFPTKVVSEEKEEKEDEEESPRVLDLKGIRCPRNYVKAKLFLENLEPGSILDIYLDEGEPISNVPKSLENDGHKILRIEKSGDFYKVRVQKATDDFVLREKGGKG